MDLIHVPELEDYWRVSWVSEIPCFSPILSRDRFEPIFWMLHVGRPAPGRQRKIDMVKPILNILFTKFQSSYNMGCNISIDETMVGFRGRFAAKQYMPKKPQKWGIKAFTLADSSTGYTI